MFDIEERVIQHAKNILQSEHRSGSSLVQAFEELLFHYEKIFKQFTRMVKMSDRMQTELKESREAILRYNDELTREVKERRKVEKSLQKANRELQRLAALDGLTQIANRRRFNEYLKHQWRQMARKNSPISLIICDIDFFKAYNDAYGHIAGDVCLQKVAETLNRGAARPLDLAARYGGEEFAVILPETDAGGAFCLAHNLKKEIDNLKIEHCKSRIHQYITVSMGVAEAYPARHSFSETLVADADEALYEAKENGRNLIVLKTDKEALGSQLMCIRKRFYSLRNNYTPISTGTLTD